MRNKIDLISLLSRHVLFPLYELVHRVDSRNWWHYLCKSQYFSAEQIRQNQWRDLQLMLHYVYKHNSFYRKRFDQIGATPDDIKSFSDFTRLPILGKKDICNNSDDMISDGFNKSELILRRTGGSTGEPIQAYWDKRSYILKEVLVRRHDAWAQFVRGERKATLWGNVKPGTSLRNRIDNTLFKRTIYLDTLKMHDNNILEFIKKIRQTRTKLLFGHAHSIYFFTEFLKDHDITSLNFNGIVTTAETLLSEERQVIEEAFGNVVFNRYGCEEIGLIASECQEHQGMHIAAEGVYVEIIETDKKGLGKVIVTDLLNHGTPLIRYEIGDLGIVKVNTCACGRGLPVLERIVGRTSDILYTPEGNRISGISVIDNSLFRVRGIRQVQIVQHKLDELILNIVKDESFSEESLEIIAESIKQYFGQSMKYKIVFLNKIPLSKRGKLQLTICKLENEDVLP